MLEFPKSKARFNLKNFDTEFVRNSAFYDRTLYLSRLTSTMIESASANLFSNRDSDLEIKKSPSREKNHLFQMFIMKRPTIRLEPIEEKNPKNRVEFSKESKQFKKDPLPYISPYRVQRFNRKVIL